MSNLQQIVDDLSKLTVREAAELAKMLEKRWIRAGTSSTMLYDDRARTRKEALRPGDGLFEFYDSCARPGYDELRSFVSGWLGDRREIKGEKRRGEAKELSKIMR